MTRLRTLTLTACAALLALAGCASRPVNPPIVHADPNAGYRFETRLARQGERDNVIILAFSGGGTRAAAFSYGGLEYLRRTEMVTPQGKTIRLLDVVDVITGVSGGSFTALAHGLCNDRLFDDYEQRFLKRDVQGEIVSRVFDPAHWGTLGGAATGRSEVAARLYDEIVFDSATFADLQRGSGPLIEISEALREAGLPSPLDGKRRVIVFIVNSVSSPPTDWDRS
jgi:NTE family protein